MINQEATEAIKTAEKHKEKVVKYHIIVTEKLKKPYYEVLYYDLTDNKWHIGYSSYCLEVVKGYIEDHFEVDESIVCGDIIEALEKQTPKKIYRDNDNGVYEKEFCPSCNKRLFSDEKHCGRCGQALDWGEKKSNG